MIVDPRDISANAIYRFLTSVVVPRPIAFVSTVSAASAFNVAPFSYFNVVASTPPLLSIAISPRKGEIKDTLRNIQDVGDFVINIVDEALNARAVEASGDWPRDVDEFHITGLTPVPSDIVRAPRVGESPVSLECTLFRLVELGQSTLVIGEMVRAHVRDDVLSDGHVDVERLRPVGRLGGDAYAPVRGVVHLPRPRVERPS